MKAEQGVKEEEKELNRSESDILLLVDSSKKLVRRGSEDNVGSDSDSQTQVSRLHQEKILHHMRRR